MPTDKLYLVSVTFPEHNEQRVLVPAASTTAAKRAVIDKHVTARLVGGVEALALSSQGVPVLAEAAAS